MYEGEGWTKRMILEDGGWMEVKMYEGEGWIKVDAVSSWRK